MTNSKPAKGKAVRLIAVEDAAKRIGVPYADLFIWLVENVEVGPTLWSHWKTGKKQVGDNHLVEFLKERIAPAPVEPERSETPVEQALERGRRPQSRDIGPLPASSRAKKKSG